MSATNYLRGKKAKKICREKKNYYTETDAIAAAKALQRSSGVPARAYRCNGMKGQQRHWHVTSGVKKRRW